MQPITDNDANKQRFIASTLPCSCRSCRRDPNNTDQCEFKSIGNAQTRDIKDHSTRTEEDNSLGDLTVVELKEVCRVCSLAVSGNKDALLQRLLPFMNALNNYEEEEVSFDDR